MDKTRLLTILRNDNVMNILKSETDTICNTLYDLLSTIPYELHSEVIDIVEKNDMCELTSALVDYAAKLDSAVIMQKYITDSISRSQAADCHMIAVSCRGIIDLLHGPYNFTEEEVREYRVYYGVNLSKPITHKYTETEINDYMNTYISDIKKYDEDIASTIESVYDKKQFDYLLAFCKYQAYNNELIAELTLTGKTHYGAHTYNKMMQDTRKYVESLRVTERDDFYSRLT